MANTKITSRVIADDAILTANIADDQITSALIADDVALGGNPTTSTQTAGNNTTRIATTAFVSTAVANIVNSAPATLDTLGEIATALNNDAALNTTLTNSIATKLPLAGGTMTGNIVMGDDTSIGIGDSAERIEFDGAGDISVLGANFGVNSTSPATKFVVQHTDGESGIEFSMGASLNYIQSYDRSASDYVALKLDGEDIRFGTNNGTERMRIDSSGNVLVKGGQELRVYRGDNATYGSMKYLTGSGGLQLNDQNGDGISFIRSGSAESMRIDGSGNVKIGDSSTDITSKLTVSGNGNAEVATFMYDGAAGTYFDIDCGAANGTVTLRADARSGSFPSLAFRTGGSERLLITNTGNISHTTEGTGNGYMNFTNNDAGGVVGYIGTGKSLVSGAGLDEIALRGEAGVLFSVSSSEKMRIASNGGLCVGSNSGANSGGVSAYVADNDTAFYANGSNGRVNIKIHTEATGGKIWYFRTGGTAHFGSGGGDLIVLNEAGSAITTWDYSASTFNGDLNDTSDVALKENITDITDATTKIKALKPRNFDWKESNKGNGVDGFIAQEVETVLPNNVVGDDYDPDNPEHGSKAINTSGILAVAVKAIQEQQTIIEDLKARIETLEG